MEIPEQDFYEQFFVGKFGDEGLNCKLASGAVEVDIASSRTEETTDISASIKLPVMSGNFECGVTSAGGINFGLSQNLLGLFDLGRVEEFNATANLMIAQNKQLKFSNYGFNSFADLVVGKFAFKAQAMQIPDDDTKSLDPSLELTALYNIDEISKVAAVATFDSLRTRIFSGQISLFTKVQSVLGLGVKLRSDFKGSDTLELYSSFHSELKNFILAGKFTYNRSTGTVENFIAFQKALDETTSFSVRTNGITGDTDGVVETKLSQNVDLRVCFGLDFTELEDATCHKKDYGTPYFGLNFDITL